MGVHILDRRRSSATLIQPNMQRLMEDIRRGTFDFVLTKPEDAQVLVSVREVRIWQRVDVLIGLVVLVDRDRPAPGTASGSTQALALRRRAGARRR